MEKKTWLYALLRLLASIFYRMLFRFKTIGKENVPTSGKAILCSNHISIADMIFLGISLKRQVFFMAKAELFRKPIGKWFFKGLGAFSIERGKADTEAVGIGVSHLEEQEHLVGIYAEGHRSKQGKLQRFKSGAAMIAYKTNSPVVPVAITYENGGLGVFHKACLSFGKPLTPIELGMVEGKPVEFRKATAVIHEIVANQIKENESLMCKKEKVPELT